jgi:hypothetical protein
MLKYIISLLSVINTYSFKLMTSYNPTSITKDIVLCNNINEKLRDTSIEVVENINQYGIFHINLYDGINEPQSLNNVNDLCDYDGFNYAYGYTSTFGNNETDIYISNYLLYTDTTLYNVVLHEMIHSLGLNHTTDTEGIMNYKLYVERNQIVEDTHKQYLSLDDIRGLRYIKNNLCECNI